MTHNVGAHPSDPALVCDRAAKRLDPTGFDPLRGGTTYAETKAYSRGYAAGRKLRGPVLAREMVIRLGLLKSADLRRIEIAIRDAIYAQFGVLHTDGDLSAAEAAIAEIGRAIAMEAREERPTQSERAGA